MEEKNYREELEGYVNSLINEIDNHNLYKEKRLVLIDEAYGYLVSDLIKMKQKINPDIEVAKLLFIRIRKIITHILNLSQKSLIKKEKKKNIL